MWWPVSRRGVFAPCWEQFATPGSHPSRGVAGQFRGETAPIHPWATVHPVTTIGDLTFDAAFDSGNAARVEAVGIPASNSAAEEYNVWTSNDCAGTPHVKEYKVWFSFAVRACSSASAAPLSGRLLAFNIYNMNNLGKLFKHDMRPVYRYLPSKPKWARLHAPTSQTGTQKGDPNFVLSFKHRCECADGDSVQFAFCFPLSYSDSMARLAWLDALLVCRRPASCRPASRRHG